MLVDDDGMTIDLYDLAAADPKIMFSPFCWRVRMSLLHKRLDFNVIPWRFSDRSATAASGYTAVPVIRDGERWVGDSWAIALYLDRTYPDAPLMHNEESRAAARLVLGVCGSVVFPAAVRVAVFAAYNILDAASKPYFRETREAMFGCTLEELDVGEISAKAGLNHALSPFTEVLAASDYLGGDTPTYADYVLFGVLKWMDIVSPYAPLDGTSAVAQWFDRVQQLYGGYAANVPTVRAATAANRDTPRA